MGLDLEPLDEDVWASVCDGDSDAFALIFRRHGDAVYTQCARRIGSWAEADDLVSTVFMEAWRSRGKVRFVDGSLRPWLFVTAQHIAAKHLRSVSRRQAMTRRLLVSADADESPDLEVVDRLDAQTLAPLLASAVSGLNGAEQELVMLCDLAQYGYAEAAQALGVPLGTVKSRLSRAHRKLRERLGPTVIEALGMETRISTPKEVRR